MSSNNHNDSIMDAISYMKSPFGAVRGELKFTMSGRNVGKSMFDPLSTCGSTFAQINRSLSGLKVSKPTFSQVFIDDFEDKEPIERTPKELIERAKAKQKRALSVPKKGKKNSGYLNQQASKEAKQKLLNDMFGDRKRTLKSKYKKNERVGMFS